MLGFGSIFLFYIGLFSIVASGIIKERENITQDKFIQGMYKHLILENSDRLIEVDCQYTKEGNPTPQKFFTCSSSETALFQ